MKLGENNVRVMQTITPDIFVLSDKSDDDETSFNETTQRSHDHTIITRSSSAVVEFYFSFQCLVHLVHILDYILKLNLNN